MTDTASPAAAGSAQPFADVLQNIGRPSLSAVTDMPALGAAEPADGAAEGAEGAGEGETGSGIDDSKAAPETVDTSGSDPDGQADAPPKKEGGEGKDEPPPWVKARITRADRKARAADERAASLELQVKQLTEAVAKLAGEKAPPKDDPRPSRDTFQDPDAYDKALEDWATRRAETKAKADAQAEQVQQHQDSLRRTLLEAHKAREETFEADHPDYQDLVYSDDVKITEPMGVAILEAEDGPAIAYYLGQNPEAAERIAGLSPARQVIEIGRISQKLAAPPPRPRPAPVTPLKASNSAGPKDPNEMNMEEYAEYRKSKSN